MKMRILGLCLAGLLVSPQAHAIFGWFEGPSAVTKLGKGAGDILKEAGKKLDKLAEKAGKIEQAQKAAANAQAAGFLGGLDSVARAILKGAVSSGTTAMKHPSLLILGTGVALYASPRLRSFVGRGMSACFNVYANRYPTSYFVRGVNTVREVWNRMNPEQVERDRAVQEHRRVELTEQELRAQAENRLRQAEFTRLTAEVTNLRNRNTRLAADLQGEIDRRGSFEGLGKQVADLNIKVTAVGAELDQQLNGNKGQLGILENLAGLCKQIGEHGNQLNSFKDVLNKRLNAQSDEVKTFVLGAQEKQQSVLAEQLKNHDVQVGQRVAEGNSGILTKIAAFTQTLNALQTQVGGLHNTFNQCMTRIPVLQNSQQLRNEIRTLTTNRMDNVQ